MTITTLPSISDKSDNTTRLTSSEFNELLDAIVQGTKPIYTQGIQIASSAYSSSGAITLGRFAAMDSSGGALTMTLAAPSAGILQIISLVTAGNDATVTCASGVTLNTTGNDTMTFDTQHDTIVLFALSATRWHIVSNTGVDLSTS